MKYSTITGVVPTIPLSADHNDGTWLPTDIYIGEVFVNSADDLTWIRTESGIIPLAGSFSATFSFAGDFVPISGGTFSGLVNFSELTSASASIDVLYSNNIIGGNITGSFSGDGSGLTGINAVWTGGTVSNPVYFTNTVDISNTVNLNGPIVGDLNVTGSAEISGGVSASIFYGDGSGLTNLPTGTYSDVYTTSASLSGNTIVFDRNDSLQYSVDLTPILGTQGVANINWDSSINSLELTLLDGSIVSTTIDNFDNLTSLTSVTAPEFYGGVFYGELVGTYSNDIYTISATLSGTDAIFTRTDGASYSLDLSTLSGGGGATPSLSDVLSVGNTTGVNDIIFGTSSGLLFNNTSRLREGTIDAGYGGNKGIAQICAVGYEMKWESGSLYIMNGDGTQIREVRYTFGATPSTSDDVTKGFTIGSRWVLDNGDLYSCSDTATASAVWNLEAVGVGNLEQTLVVGNYAGENHILIKNGYGLSNYNGVQTSKGITFDNDAVIMYAGTGSFDDSGALGLVSVLNSEGTVSIQTQGNVEYNMNYLGAGSGFFNVSGYTGFKGIEYASDYSGSYSVRSLVDKEYVDNAITGSTPSLSSVLLVGNTTGANDISVDYSRKIFSSYTYSTSNYEHKIGFGNNPGALQIVTINNTNGKESRIELVGNGNGLIQVDNALSINTPSFTVSDTSGGTAFAGIEYDIDYSSNYTNRSLVDKEYVDLIAGGTPSLSDVLLVGNTTGPNWIEVDSGYGLIGTYSTTTDAISIDPEVLGNGTGIKSLDTVTGDYTQTTYTPDVITTTVNNITNGGGSITTTVNDTTTGNSSLLIQRSDYRQFINNVDDGLGNAFRIEILEQPDDVYKLIFTDDNTGDQYYRQTNNISSYETIGNSAIGIVDTISLDPSGVSLGTGIKSLDTATDDYTQTTHTPTQISLYNISTTNDADIHFEINDDNVLSSITDNGWSTYIENSLSGLSNGSKQQRLQISPNTSIFVTDDKRAGWMQTSDDTTTLMIYCDMDPSVGSTSSVVQIKAHVRGISSDKTIGYAAEITSWVRVNSSSVVQIGTVDYTIKSEFTTASSSFVISGPNMYIDVTGEIGVTIDWTCNVELLYDKNTF